MPNGPKNPTERLRAAKRCHAARKRDLEPCNAPAVRGWNVCRVHGAGGGAPRGERQGNYRHGQRTIEAKTERRLFRDELRQLRMLARELAEAKDAS